MTGLSVTTSVTHRHRNKALSTCSRTERARDGLGIAQIIRWATCVVCQRSRVERITKLLPACTRAHRHRHRHRHKHTHTCVNGPAKDFGRSPVSSGSNISCTKVIPAPCPCGRSVLALPSVAWVVHAMELILPRLPARELAAPSPGFATPEPFARGARDRKTLVFY